MHPNHPVPGTSWNWLPQVLRMTAGHSVQIKQSDKYQVVGRHSGLMFLMSEKLLARFYTSRVNKILLIHGVREDQITLAPDE